VILLECLGVSIRLVAVRATKPPIGSRRISNQESAVSNPSIDNPSIDNPSIDNPSICNLSINNPSIGNRQSPIGNDDLAQKRLAQASVHRNDMTCRLGALVAGEPADRVGIVDRQDGPTGNGPLRVELRQFGPKILC
jgi:hypothetical protein